MKTCLHSIVLLTFLAAGFPAFASEAAPGIAPAQVLKMLKDGNERYSTGVARHPHTDPARLHDTAEHGQHPLATVIACSDSRCPVELLFDSGIGDLFVIRVAGNVCDTDEIGSIEYGVEHLGTPLLVVLGHDQCGAVTAVATHAEVHGKIPALVDNIGPAVDKAQRLHPDLHGQDLVPAAVEANVWQAIEDLLQGSDATRQRIRNGKLMVVGAIYHLEDGRINWLGAHPEQARLLKDPSR